MSIQLADERTRDAAWAYVEHHIDELGQRLSVQALPAMASSLCSTATAGRLKASFGARLSRVQGGPQSLAGAVERLEVCAAEAAIEAVGVRSFFTVPKRAEGEPP